MKTRTRVTGSLTASGTAAANYVVANVQTAQKALVDVSGTFVGTVTFEATVDGSTWFTVGGHSAAVAETTVVTTATAGGLFIVDVTGYASFRARCTAYTSGTIVVAVTSAFLTYRAL